MLSVSDLSSKKLVELKKLCQAKGLSADGRKADLIERLTPVLFGARRSNNSRSRSRSAHVSPLSEATASRMSTRSSSQVGSLRGSSKLKLDTAKRNMEAMEYLSGENYVEAIGREREARSNKKIKHTATKGDDDTENLEGQASNIEIAKDTLVAEKLIDLMKTVSVPMSESADKVSPSVVDGSASAATGDAHESSYVDMDVSEARDLSTVYPDEDIEEYDDEKDTIDIESEEEFLDADVGPDLGSIPNAEEDSPRLDPSRVAEVEQAALEHSMMREESEGGINVEEFADVEEYEMQLGGTHPETLTDKTEDAFLETANKEEEIDGAGTLIKDVVEEAETMVSMDVSSVRSVSPLKHDEAPPPAQFIAQTSSIVHPQIPSDIPAVKDPVGFDGAVQLLVGVLTDKLKGAVAGSGAQLSKNEYKVLRTLLETYNESDEHQQAHQQSAPIETIKVAVEPCFAVTTPVEVEVDDAVTSLKQSDKIPERSEVQARVATSLAVISELGSRKRSEESSDEPAGKKRALSDFRFPLISSLTSPVSTSSMVVPRTIAADNRPYVPTYQDNVAKFTSLVQPSVSTSISKRKHLTLTDHRRRTATSASTSIVARRILDSLSDMTGPLEQQRQAPVRVMWRAEQPSLPKTPAPSLPPETLDTVNTEPPPHSLASSLRTKDDRISDVASSKDTNKRLSFSKEVTVYEHDYAPVEQESTVISSTINETEDQSDALRDEFEFVAPLVVHDLPDLEETQDIRFAFSPPKNKNLSSANLKPIVSVSAAPQLTESVAPARPVEDVRPSVDISASSSAVEVPVGQVHSAFEKYMNRDKVKCESCLVMNDKSASACVSCETPLAPSASSTVPHAAVPSPAPISFVATKDTKTIESILSLGASTSSASTNTSTGFFFGSKSSSSIPALTNSTTASTSIRNSLDAETVKGHKSSPFSFSAPVLNDNKIDGTNTNLSSFSFGSTSGNANETTTSVMKDQLSTGASTTFSGFSFGKPIISSISTNIGSVGVDLGSKAIATPFVGSFGPSHAVAPTDSISSTNATTAVSPAPFPTFSVSTSETSATVVDSISKKRAADSTDDSALNKISTTSSLSNTQVQPAQSEVSKTATPGFMFGSLQSPQSNASATFGAITTSSAAIDNSTPKFGFADTSSSKGLNIFGSVPSSISNPLAVDSVTPLSTSSLSFGQTKPPPHSSTFAFGNITSVDKSDNLTPKTATKIGSGYETDSPGSTMDTGSNGETAQVAIPAVTVAAPASFGMPSSLGGFPAASFDTTTVGTGTSSSTHSTSSFLSAFGKPSSSGSTAPASSSASIFSFNQSVANPPTATFGFGLQSSSSTFATSGGFAQPTSATPVFGKTTPSSFGLSQSGNTLAPTFSNATEQVTAPFMGGGINQPFGASVVGQPGGPFGQPSAFHIGSVDSSKNLATRKKVKAKRS